MSVQQQMLCNTHTLRNDNYKTKLKRKAFSKQERKGKIFPMPIDHHQHAHTPAFFSLNEWNRGSPPMSDSMEIITCSEAAPDNTRQPLLHH